MNTLKKIFCSVGEWKRLALLCALGLLLTAAAGFSLSFLVTQTPSLYNMFTSGLNPTGDLVIRKTVEHPFGGNYTVPEELAFTFSVDLGAEHAGETIDGRTADDHGVITVTVNANNAVTLREIPAGTSVTVTEQQSNPGFTPQDGKAEQTAVIEKGAVTSLEFVNTYTPSPARLDDLTVMGQKTLVGRDWQEGDSFTFQLALFENGDWTELGTETVTYRLTETEDPENPGQTILAPEPDFDRLDFTQLLRSVRFDAAGSYSFRITETEGLSGAITYDKAESRFDILVGDADMDGYLEIQSITTASANTQIDGFAVFASFENRYAPIGSAEAVIQIHKLFTDTSGQNKAPAGFTFALYTEDGALVQTSEATAAAGETEIRLIFEPTDAGKTFVYTLKEINGGQTIDGVDYDSTEIKLQISVADNLDGTVSAYVYEYQTPAEQPPETEEPEETEETLPETEEIEETSPEAGETEETPPETEKTEETPPETEEIEEMSSEAGETEETIPETGEPEETPQETEEPEETIPETGEPEETSLETEATQVLEMSAVISTIPAGASGSYQAEFQNIYDPQNAGVTITGSKELTGRDMKAGEFRFTLYETGSDFRLGENAQKVDSVTNSGSEGDFSFAELSYSQVGTYYYVVAEDTSAPLGGVSYDKTRYLVTVHVTDDAGVLTPEVTITDGTGQESEILFRNIYRAAKTSVALTGEKVLSGRELADGEFSFALYAADQSFAYTGTALQTVKNDGDGQFRFEELSYTEAGAWYYVVKEQAVEPIPGVVYDTTEYYVTVRVEDNGEGALIPTVERQAVRAGDQTPAETLRFENRYSDNYATASVTVKKLVNNTGAGTIGPEGFTFRLDNTDTGGSVTAVSDDLGAAAFTLNYTLEEAGKTYHYRLTEVDDGREGVTYSDAVYDFEITLSQDESGRLLASVSYNGETVADLTVEFVNTYAGTGNGTEAGAEGGAETGTGTGSGTETETGTGAGTSGSSSDTPHTGDDRPVMVYAVLMAVSTVALIALLVVYIRWKRRGKK